MRVDLTNWFDTAGQHTSSLWQHGYPERIVYEAEEGQRHVATKQISNVQMLGLRQFTTLLDKHGCVTSQSFRNKSEIKDNFNSHLNIFIKVEIPNPVLPVYCYSKPSSSLRQPFFLPSFLIYISSYNTGNC